MIDIARLDHPLVRACLDVCSAPVEFVPEGYTASLRLRDVPSDGPRSLCAGTNIQQDPLADGAGHTF